MPTLFGQPHLTYTPTGGQTPPAVDLSCHVRPGITFDAPVETVDDPVLCDPGRSRVKPGAASVELTFVLGDDYDTVLGSLLGTAGRLEARVPDEDGPGFGADVTFPTQHGVTFDEDGFAIAELTLGSSAPEFLPAVVGP
jgi:hypothetical protein